MIVSTRLLKSALAIIGTVILCTFALPDSAGASAPGSAIGVSAALGFDGCQNVGQQPTLSQMSAFWSGTPYYINYFYVGGADNNNNSYCGPGNTDAAWLSSVLSMGYSVVPIYVGRYGNCVDGSATNISCDPATAVNEGISDADLAFSEWLNYGFNGNSIAPCLDIEAYDTTTTNRTAVMNYLNGWDSVFTNQRSCAYGSGIGSSPMDWATIPNVPADIWIADSGPTTPPVNNSVWGLSGVSDTVWTSYQRYHQDVGEHYETRNGVQLYVDTDCAGSYVAPTGYLPPAGTGPSGDPSCNAWFSGP